MPDDKKTCKMCGMEIPKAARKCPYCHYLQNRVVLLLYHPLFATLIAVIPFVVMIGIVGSLLHRGQDYQKYSNQITVTDSHIVFGEKKSGSTVDVIGTITNASGVSWVDPYFHVDFFDAGGRRMDAAAVENYEYYLPAGQTLSFKLSFAREFQETNYAKVDVRIVSAKDARSRF